MEVPLAMAGRQYLLEFDPTLRLDDQWVSAEELHCFNQLREDMNITIRQSSARKLKKFKKAQEQDLRRRQVR